MTSLVWWNNFRLCCHNVGHRLTSVMRATSFTMLRAMALNMYSANAARMMSFTPPLISAPVSVLLLLYAAAHTNVQSHYPQSCTPPPPPSPSPPAVYSFADPGRQAAVALDYQPTNQALVASCCCCFHCWLLAQLGCRIISNTGVQFSSVRSISQNSCECIS